MIEWLTSACGAARRAAAFDFLASLPAAGEAVLIGASRSAVDELVHEFVGRRAAAFGLYRFTLTQLAARLAHAELAHRALAPASPLASVALSARVAFTARQAGAIPHFAPVARCPGFARSAAGTLTELRAAGLRAANLVGRGGLESELAALLESYDAELGAAGLADRAALFAAATRAVAGGATAAWQRPVLLLDVALVSAAEAAFAGALASAAPRALVTMPAGDERSAAAFAGLDAIRLPDPDAQPRGPTSSLGRLRTYLFAAESPLGAVADDSVRFFSAPGEGREAVEIARAILDEAAAGTPFDEMAVLLRTPALYTPLLAAAFRRAEVPAYFARGTTRPDPAGRALLALLACAADDLSAKRFAEYLSFGQVPKHDGAAADGTWIAADEEELGAAFSSAAVEVAAEDGGSGDERSGADSGTIPAPWRWEELLVDAAVLGGAARWEARLSGLAAELRTKRAALDDDPDAPLAASLARDLAQLEHVRRFALPVVRTLAAWPAEATWGEWLAHLTALVPRVLRRPQGVLRVCSELAPMASVGPVGLDEVRQVLAERLSTLTEDPPPTRYGRVFVAPLDEARGRSFAVAFVPGLAERVFPQRPREDPLLPDERRAALHPALLTQRERSGHERALLRLAAGAARQRLYLSYPRLDVVEARPRVTSFYGLDVARAVRGGIPDVEALARDADAAVHARLAWPAPTDPARAIDAAEHDLASIAALLDSAPAAPRRGTARYLLDLNPHLARALRTRYARWLHGPWRPYDGLVRTTPATAPVLAAHSLRARPYSPSALEHYAVCPYRFYLHAIARLAPRQPLAGLEQLDPMTRGRLFHRVQAETLRALGRAGALPLDRSTWPQAERLLEDTLAAEAQHLADAVRPPIARVWDDAIAALRADLITWLRHFAAEPDWQPRFVEFGFGLPADAERDPASRAEPVQVAASFWLRGAVDLVEQHRDGRTLRVIDHKTGIDRTAPGLTVGGGEALQPVLYALAVEAASGQPVSEARLSFCTARGGFSERIVRLDEPARVAAAAVLDTIDRAVTQGLLPPAPRDDACPRCDFRAICGPYEAERLRRKDAAPLRPLQQLRARP